MNISLTNDNDDDRVHGGGGSHGRDQGGRGDTDGGGNHDSGGGHGGPDHGPGSGHSGGGQHGHKTNLKTRIRPETAFQEIEVDASGTLLDLLKAGAIAGGQTILPPDGTPLDRVYGLDNHHVVGPALSLDEGIEHYLHLPHTSKEFEIELVLAIRVNARWAIATSEMMSPREILKLPGINLAPEDYSLYNPGSNEPLPPDVAITLHRGQRFEAQRDGKYGAS